MVSGSSLTPQRTFISTSACATTGTGIVAVTGTCAWLRASTDSTLTFLTVSSNSSWWYRASHGLAMVPIELSNCSMDKLKNWANACLCVLGCTRHYLNVSVVGRLLRLKQQRLLSPTVFYNNPSFVQNNGKNICLVQGSFVWGMIFSYQKNTFPCVELDVSHLHL